MPIGDLLAQISGEASRSSTTSIQKRKAEDDSQQSNNKQMKRDQNTGNISRPTSQIKRPGNLEVASLKANPVLTASAPSFVSKASNSSASAPHGSAAVNPTITNSPAKAPKKGSFAEIMARGKVAQATFGQVGKIQHKPIEKGLNRKERQEMKAQKLHKSRPNGKPGPGGKKSARDGEGNRGDKGKGLVQNPDQSPAPEKKMKKAALATTGYTGTARHIPGSNKSARSMQTHQTIGKDSSSSHRDECASEEEDDEEDSYSDVSSDMEAAAFEVDEEEARAARIARKEDDEALAQENLHRREKEEKRRMLAAMARRRR